MNWEPWTGCYKVSDGCKYCYFYGPYAKRFGQNKIEKTNNFDLPIRKDKNNEYTLKGNQVIPTCFATDFFLVEADKWREEIWRMIKERQDLEFLILTKRIERFLISLPADWGKGYDNVNIGCSVENQELADYRLPLFLSYPIKRRFISCSPLLGKIDLSSYLSGIEHVTVAGEKSKEARVCDYDWVNDIFQQCQKSNTTFWFKSTGSLFKYNGVIKKINPYKQSSLAKEFDLNIF